MANLAFLGLGVMGFPMAGHLQKAGHSVTVYNRSAAKAAAWVAKHGGKSAATPAEAAKGADIVLACVGNDDDLRSVVYGDAGAFAGMAKGAIFVDHTTASAQVSRELDKAASEKGFGFLDAPVSGGQAGAENGQLGIMVGGADAVFAKAEPVLKIYAKALTLMGPAGAGSLAQVVNAAIANKARFEQMREFFGDTGGGDKAGVWEGVPVERPEFRAETKRQVIKLMKKRKAEEMI
jgi:3-hydroxyisobutyrate dehydrogenase